MALAPEGGRAPLYYDANGNPIYEEGDPNAVPPPTVGAAQTTTPAPQGLLAAPPSQTLDQQGAAVGIAPPEGDPVAVYQAEQAAVPAPAPTLGAVQTSASTVTPGQVAETQGADPNQPIGLRVGAPEPLMAGGDTAPTPSASGYYGGLQSSEFANSMIPGRVRQQVLHPAATSAAEQKRQQSDPNRLSPTTDFVPPPISAAKEGLVDVGKGLAERAGYIHDHFNNAITPFLEDVRNNTGYSPGTDFAGRLLGLDPNDPEMDMHRQAGRNVWDWMGDLAAEEIRAPLETAVNTGPIDVFLRGAANMLEPPINAIEWLGGKTQEKAPEIGAAAQRLPGALKEYAGNVLAGTGMIVPQVASTDVPTPDSEDLRGVFENKLQTASTEKNRPGATNMADATIYNIADARNAANNASLHVPTQDELESMSIDALRSVAGNPLMPEETQQDVNVILGRYAAKQAGMYEGPIVQPPNLAGMVERGTDTARQAASRATGAPDQPEYIPEAGAMMSRGPTSLPTPLPPSSPQPNRGAPDSLPIPPPPPADLRLGPPAQPQYIPEAGAMMSRAPTPLPFPSQPTSPQPDRPFVVSRREPPLKVLDRPIEPFPDEGYSPEPGWQEQAGNWLGEKAGAFRREGEDTQIAGQDASGLADAAADLPIWDLQRPQVSLGVPPPPTQWALPRVDVGAPPPPTQWADRLPEVSLPTNLDALPQISVPEILGGGGQAPRQTPITRTSGSRPEDMDIAGMARDELKGTEGSGVTLMGPRVGNGIDTQIIRHPDGTMESAVGMTSDEIKTRVRELAGTTDDTVSQPTTSGGTEEPIAKGARAVPGGEPTGRTMDAGSSSADAPSRSSGTSGDYSPRGGGYSGRSGGGYSSRGGYSGGGSSGGFGGFGPNFPFDTVARPGSGMDSPIRAQIMAMIAEMMAGMQMGGLQDRMTGGKKKKGKNSGFLLESKRGSPYYERGVRR